MAQGFFFTGDEGNLATRRRLYEAMVGQGSSTAPVSHWTQGLARALTGVTGVLGMDKADKEQKRVDQEAMAGILGAGRPDTVTGSTGMEAAASPASSSSTSTSSAPAASGSAPGAFGQIAPRLVSDLQRDFGLSREQAAGIAGPLAMESAGFGTLQEVRPLIPGSRGGFGYAQWTGPRRRAFESWSQQNGLDPTSYEANYGFLRHELQNTGEGRVLQSLRGINDPQAAAQTFTNQFLRPGIPNMPARMNWTNRVLGVRAPQDRLDGGDGSEAPMIDGRTLPDSGVLAAPDLAGSFDQMRMAAPGPMDPRARSFDQITRAGAGMQPSQAVSPAPSVDNMMAGSQVVQPMQAPMPVPRPEMPMQAPMPMARPNMEPPPGAQPAMAPQAPAMGGMSERDRLMMLRDEGSLAPGEADRIRAALTGASPMQAPVNPMDRLRQMVMGGGSAPAAPSATATAQSQPTASPAAPAAAPAGDARSRLMGIVMNPNVSPTVRQGAMLALQQMQPAAPVKLGAEDRLVDPRTGRELIAPSGNRLTDDERNFLNYEREERAGGRTPLSRFEWGQQRRRAQSNSVNVNTATTGDDAFTTETAKKQAAMFDTLVQDGGTARSDAARIAELRRLGDRIGTGAGASLQGFAAQYGIKLGDNVSEIEAFQAIVNQLVPQQRPAGSGAMSDRDVELFRNSLPSLVKTPGGNAILFDTMQGIADYRQQQAQIAAQAQTGAIPRAEAIRQLNALPDPLKAFRESRRAPEGGAQAAPPRTAPAAGVPTATNPRTGERIQFINGQWVPMR